MSAQIDVDEICGTPPPEFPDPPGVYSRSVDPVYLNNFDPVTFNIFFWGIAKDDGTWTNSQMTLQKAQDAVALLNEHFGPFNICFNLVGMDIINSTPHHLGSAYSTILTFANQNGFVKENSYNIYVPEGFNGPAGAPTGVTSYFSTKIGIRACCVVHPTFVHEMGHTLNLHHTFGNSNTRPHPTNCERVTRNINHPNYNATFAGDEIHDTNAVPNFFREQHNYVAYAIANANIGFSWSTARDSIAFSPIGFNSLPDANAIEQALIDYGFTADEINHLKFNPAVDHAYYDIQNKIYTPDNRVNDPNLDFFKDCQGAPYQILESDFENFMAYTHSSCKELFTIGQGIRMHETINSLNTNSPLYLAKTQYPIDLYTRDHEGDIGQEPNIHNDIFWQSPDIWVRNQNDGFSNQTHQNPEYNPFSPNYAYVRVFNKGCVASTGTEELFLHWAKAGTGAGWPALWNGGITDPVLMGNLVYEQTIPVIQPGDEAILEFEWYPPNPDDYIGVSPNNDPWHFCLLSRIVTPNDPMAFPEGYGNMVYRNNNIALKNVTVVNNPTPGSLSPGGAIFIGNIVGLTTATFNFEFKTMDVSSSPIFEEAEVVLTLNENTWDRWLDGGRQSENIEIYPKGERQLIITGNNARLNNLEFGAEEWDVMYVSFNFLTKEVTNKALFEYLTIQYDATTNEIIGGETYQITRDITRPHFEASASVTEENGEISFSAINIGEAAKYNWYSPDGTLVHTGEDFTFTGSFAGEYTLEVIAENDAHKDYFYYLVETHQNDDQIISLSPNPANSTVLVNYQINNATTANLQLVKFFDSFTTDFTINPSESEITLNLTNHPTGIYAVVLIVDGQPVHGVQLLKN